MGKKWQHNIVIHPHGSVSLRSNFWNKDGSHIIPKVMWATISYLPLNRSQNLILLFVTSRKQVATKIVAFSKFRLPASPIFGLLGQPTRHIYLYVCFPAVSPRSSSVFVSSSSYISTDCGVQLLTLLLPIKTRVISIRQEVRIYLIESLSPLYLFKWIIYHSMAFNFNTKKRIKSTNLV